MISLNSANQNKVILIVDDDTSIRMTAVLALENQGYLILEADSGQACLDICQRQKPDLILLDAVMPGMDGFTCCLKIKKLFGLQSPPIFMMTVLDDRDSVYRSFDVGITDYFTKPLDWASLPEKIAKIFLSRAQNAKLHEDYQEIYSLKEKLDDMVYCINKTNQKNLLNEFNCA